MVKGGLHYYRDSTFINLVIINLIYFVEATVQHINTTDLRNTLDIGGCT